MQKYLDYDCFNEYFKIKNDEHVKHIKHFPYAAIDVNW